MTQITPVHFHFTGTRALRLAAEARARGLKPEEFADRLADWALENAGSAAVDRHMRRARSVPLTPLRNAIIYVVALHLDDNGVARLLPRQFADLIKGSSASSISLSLLGLEEAGLLRRHAPRAVRMPQAWRLTDTGRQVADDLGDIGFKVKGVRA